MIPGRFFVIVVGIVTLLTFQAQPTATQTTNQLSELLRNPGSIQSPLSTRDDKIIQSISTSEWLGPMAPVAISPFFGITCLAGISQFGGDYLPINGFISDNAVLKNQWVFWIFLVLTLVTSLPRLTKVSKPFAQALDQVETYAGIITILVLRFAVSPPEANEQVAFVQMGFLSVSADVLLSIAAIINIVVINSIKFFFEMLVWIIPFPFVDACLEACNKTLCVGLMAIYAWSPFVATVLNLLLFVVCLLAFNWAKRRITFVRTMLFEWLWSCVSADYGKPPKDGIIAFCKSSLDCFPARARVQLSKTETGWRLTEHRLLFPDRILNLDRGSFRLSMHEGMFINSIHGVPLSQTETTNSESESSPTTETVDEFELHFSRRYNRHLELVARELDIERTEKNVEIAIEL